MIDIMLAEALIVFLTPFAFFALGFVVTRGLTELVLWGRDCWEDYRERRRVASWSEAETFVIDETEGGNGS